MAESMEEVLVIKPLKPVGAEVQGLDLSQPLSEETKTRLRAACGTRMRCCCFATRRSRSRT